MKLAESLNRTMKLAMDEGRVQSYEEALALFASFRLRLQVAPGFTSSPGAQAAVLTLLRAGPKTFLGGIELVGPLDEVCTLAWFAGKTLGDVALSCGVHIDAAADAPTPTLCVGAGAAITDSFWLGLRVERDGFSLTPGESLMSADGGVEAGVAGAGAALHQAFEHIYRQAPLAGWREIAFRMPGDNGSPAARNQWLIGLGHLGQAYLWTAMLRPADQRPSVVRLTDDDTVSASSLSTCLLVDAADIGRYKTDAVAQRLESLGVKVQRDAVRLAMDTGPVDSAHPLCIVAVDNLTLRRALDRLQGCQLLEAGIGDGVDGFTRVQAHAFPGHRLARDVWAGEDRKASRAVDISKPAYRRLLQDSGDECGTTLVAGRSVATPFVGAFAGAVLARLSTTGALRQHEWSFDVGAL